MAFVQRALNFTFTLSQGTFANGSPSLAIAGVRASCRIQNAGGTYATENMLAQIWGLPLDVMNRLATLGIPYNINPANQPSTFNKVQVDATDVDQPSGFSAVFIGHITWCFADFSQMPNVPMQVVAYADYEHNIKPAAVTSIKGNQDVGSICSGLAGKMGLAFQNFGVNAQLANPYLWGPLRFQLGQAIEAADVAWNGASCGKVQIWPRGNPIEGNAILVSSATGMVGSPSYTTAGIVMKTIYNPAIRQGVGLQVVSNNIPGLSGNTWVVYSISHSLDAMVPRGEWFSTTWAGKNASTVKTS